LTNTFTRHFVLAEKSCTRFNALETTEGLMPLLTKGWKILKDLPKSHPFTLLRGTLSIGQQKGRSLFSIQTWHCYCGRLGLGSKEKLRN